MSSEDVKTKATETLKSVKELLKATKAAAHAELSRTAPKVTDALDRSFDSASKSLAETLRVVNHTTRKEEVELLKAYRAFLQQQIELIDKRVRSESKRISK